MEAKCYEPARSGMKMPRFWRALCVLACVFLWVGVGFQATPTWAAKKRKTSKKRKAAKAGTREAPADTREPAKADDRTAARPAPPPRRAAPPKPRTLSGEQLYKFLVASAKKGNASTKTLFKNLHKVAHEVAWNKGKKLDFLGHLRFLKHSTAGKSDDAGGLYLLRKEDGAVMLLALPKQGKVAGTSPYANLKKAMRHKMNFSVQLASTSVGGTNYTYAKLLKKPKRGTLDRLFFIAIVALLFFVMLGMGMTLTMADFALIFKEPKGMLVGPLCQFGLLPLLAFGIGHLFGFVHTAPFIFMGLLLISSSPGGVTSNLMTYFAKGDVALSVSLTALSTVLSIFFTPLLLGLYGSNVPNLKVPVGAIMVQIMVLVIVPLGLGLFLRAKTPKFAAKSEKFFSILGVFSLIFLIVIGVLSNLAQFANTARYNAKFYAAIFLLTFSGMFLGAAISKLLRVSNFQTRAIALETGLQNASLAMTFALLLQDRMGDFHSSMFFTSGIFGLWMYFAGAAMLLLFRAWLPIDLAAADAANAEATAS